MNFKFYVGSFFSLVCFWETIGLFICKFYYFTGPIFFNFFFFLCSFQSIENPWKREKSNRWPIDQCQTKHSCFMRTAYRFCVRSYQCDMFFSRSISLFLFCRPLFLNFVQDEKISDCYLEFLFYRVYKWTHELKIYKNIWSD